MTDLAGTVVQRFSYDEFGRLSPASALSGQQYRYTGRRFDAETGLYYYRARYYSPDLGRFLSTDPAGYVDDANLYAYVGNDPLNFIDPTGKYECIPNGDGTSDCTSTGIIDAIVMQAAVAANNLVAKAVGIWNERAPESEETQGNDAPKTSPPNPNGSRGSQEHQDKIRRRIGELEEQGHTPVAGGDEKEETVRTPGGYKERRRPDITTIDSDGKPYRENIGRQNKDGRPVSRERKALEDIENATGQCAFTPYNCK